MRHDIKALLGYINSTARANAVGSALNTRERRIDRLYLRIARMSETLEDFIHLRFDRIVLPVRIRRLSQVVVDAMKPSAQFGKAFSELFLSGS